MEKSAYTKPGNGLPATVPKVNHYLKKCEVENYGSMNHPVCRQARYHSAGADNLQSSIFNF
jgi:hypothetical protein